MLSLCLLLVLVLMLALALVLVLVLVLMPVLVLIPPPCSTLKLLMDRRSREKVLFCKIYFRLIALEL